jgi:DNA repair protein SbcC/Rad50
MIFKRFFKPKWQHPDAAVRQQAIVELNRDDQAHKTVLHELAFNDGAEAVRKAALVKLNDFSLWWQASKHDNAERLQQLAEQTLIQQLLKNEVEPKLKQQFIAQCNRSSILEQLAQTETDAGIKFSLLQRLNKSELNIKALQDPVLQLSQKQQLLAGIDDEKTLEKLSKQLDGELLSELQQKLTDLQQQKHKPVLLRKQLTLLLAKLNAVRERHSLAEVPAQLAAYQQQWQQLEPELGCLADEAAEFSAKYDKIVSQLQQWLAPKLAVLEQLQQQQRAELAAAEQQQALLKRCDALEQALAQQLLQADINAAEQVAQQLPSLLADVNQAEQTVSTTLSKRLTQMQQQISQLPQLAEQLAGLTCILADWAAAPLPQDALTYQQQAAQLTQWQQEWRQITKAMSIAVPPSLQQAKVALTEQWQPLAAQFQAETDKLQRQCRSKLAQYRRLYGAGKFKVLFGLFKGIEADYQQLTPAQQTQLAKDYEFARDKMAELADWQEYIATPRKQQLLAQMQQQLSTELPDEQIRARADEVKRARAQWNSLGKADPAQEDELNTAFDVACEQAFAPCRQYFAALDAQRAEHVIQRQQIIDAAQQLQHDTLDAKVLDKQLQQLKHAWQQAGAVDKQQFSELNQQFNQAIQPLREQLSAAQQQVAEAKQQVIAKARAALQQPEPNLTAKILKECQQQWKTLGSAARKQDQQLWLEFRAVCDGFFSTRAELLEQQKQAEQAELQQFTTQLSQLSEQVQQAHEPAQFNALMQQLYALQPQSAAAQHAVRRALDSVTLRLQQWQQLQQQREFTQLFELLADSNVTAEQLPVAFRDSFAKAQEQQFNRAQLTLALEIVCEVQSPQSEQAARQQVQLLLLSDKHNQGNVLDKHSLLLRWLQFGALAANEMTLLARVKVLFA